MVRRHACQLWILGMLCLPLQPACGQDQVDAGAPRLSRADAQDLAGLAPPSRFSTAAATYGDAAFAPRSRHPRYGVAAHELGADAPVGLYFCAGSKRRAGRQLCVRDAHELGADAPVGLYFCAGSKRRAGRQLCVRDPRRVGFRQFYVYTPVYATSPQVPRDGLGREPSLLPPATRFFYSANTRLFGNLSDE